MCRLFAWHSTSPVTAAQALGPDAPALLELSKQMHNDGWGLAFECDKHIEVIREVEAAHKSDQFIKVTNDVSATDALLHLRYATLDLSVCLPNTHPFQKIGPTGPVAFCHNGSIPLGDDLNSLIDVDLFDGLDGDTDSERYFAALISAMRRHSGDVVNAYREVLKNFAELKYTSANSMLLTDDDLFVLCAHKPENRYSEFPPDYYDIHWRNLEGVITAWSQGIRSSGGEFLENGHLLQVSRKTGITTIHHVA